MITKTLTVGDVAGAFGADGDASTSAALIVGEEDMLRRHVDHGHLVRLAPVRRAPLHADTIS